MSADALAVLKGKCVGLKLYEEKKIAVIEFDGVGIKFMKQTIEIEATAPYLLGQEILLEVNFR